MSNTDSDKDIVGQTSRGTNIDWNIHEQKGCNHEVGQTLIGTKSQVQQSFSGKDTVGTNIDLDKH